MAAMLRRLFGLPLLTAALALAGCITPSIPIPPPDEDRMTFTMDAASGSATFTYPADVNFSYAVVYVFNRDQGQGVIDTARADGSVGPTAPLPAVSGDQIVVTFDSDGEATSACIVLDADGRDPTASCAP